MPYPTLDQQLQAQRNELEKARANLEAAKKEQKDHYARMGALYNEIETLHARSHAQTSSLQVVTDEDRSQAFAAAKAKTAERREEQDKSSPLILKIDDLETEVETRRENIGKLEAIQTILRDLDDQIEVAPQNPTLLATKAKIDEALVTLNNDLNSPTPNPSKAFKTFSSTAIAAINDNIINKPLPAKTASSASHSTSTQTPSTPLLAKAAGWIKSLVAIGAPILVGAISLGSKAVASVAQLVNKEVANQIESTGQSAALSVDAFAKQKEDAINHFQKWVTENQDNIKEGVADSLREMSNICQGPLTEESANLIKQRLKSDSFRVLGSAASHVDSAIDHLDPKIIERIHSAYQNSDAKALTSAMRDAFQDIGSKTMEENSEITTLAQKAAIWGTLKVAIPVAISYIQDAAETLLPRATQSPPQVAASIHKVAQRSIQTLNTVVAAKDTAANVTTPTPKGV